MLCLFQEADIQVDDDSAIGVVSFHVLDRTRVLTILQTDDELSTASLRSSLLEYHMINGRGYHRDESM